MAANAQVYTTTTVQGSPIVTDAETVICTIDKVSIDQYAQNVRLEAMVALTTPASCTGVDFKWRRNTVTGTQVGATVTISLVEAVAYALEAPVVAAQPMGQHSYVLTATMTAAGANTTVAAIVASAIVGN